jgi:hypothetical protein
MAGWSIVLPDFEGGVLPPGIHSANWSEIVTRCGFNDHRQRLLDGLRRALIDLARARCKCAYLDGSFVTAKEKPGDFDLCWETQDVSIDKLTPELRQVNFPRSEQKSKYCGDIFPNLTEGRSNKLFLEFFQLDRETGKPKGIIVVDLSEFSHDQE